MKQLDTSGPQNATPETVDLSPDNDKNRPHVEINKLEFVEFIRRPVDSRTLTADQRMAAEVAAVKDWMTRP
jgi:hypothetical protein